MLNFIRQFVKEEEGATAVEYGLMVALIAAVIVTVVATLGGQVNTAFNTVSAALPGGS
jgi:pilus assembly protein Flp/PilA